MIKFVGIGLLVLGIGMWLFATFIGAFKLFPHYTWFAQHVIGWHITCIVLGTVGITLLIVHFVR